MGQEPGYTVQRLRLKHSITYRHMTQGGAGGCSPPPPPHPFGQKVCFFGAIYGKTLHFAHKCCSTPHPSPMEVVRYPYGIVQPVDNTEKCWFLPVCQALFNFCLQSHSEILYKGDTCYCDFVKWLISFCYWLNNFFKCIAKLFWCLTFILGKSQLMILGIWEKVGWQHYS